MKKILKTEGMHCSSCSMGSVNTKKLIFGLFLLSIFFVYGCSTSTNVIELTLSKKNIEYFGYDWDLKNQLIESCENIKNNEPCDTENGRCPTLGLVKLAYALQDIPQEHAFKIGCSAAEGENIITAKSLIALSRIVPITTTFRENHSFEICCKLDEDDVKSNEVCFNHEISALC